MIFQSKRFDLSQLIVFFFIRVSKNKIREPAPWYAGREDTPAARNFPFLAF